MKAGPIPLIQCAPCWTDWWLISSLADGWFHYLIKRPIGFTKLAAAKTRLALVPRQIEREPPSASQDPLEALHLSLCALLADKTLSQV